MQNASLKTQLTLWLIRLFFILTVLALAYAAFKPDFFAWQIMPHNFLRAIGVPYNVVLFIESNFGAITHSLGALLITLCLLIDNFFGRCLSIKQKAVVVFLMLLAAPVIEVLQIPIGRGYSWGDVLWHWSGVLLALPLSLLINRFMLRSNSNIN